MILKFERRVFLCISKRSQELGRVGQLFRILAVLIAIFESLQLRLNLLLLLKKSLSVGHEVLELNTVYNSSEVLGDGGGLPSRVWWTFVVRQFGVSISILISESTLYRIHLTWRLAPLIVGALLHVLSWVAVVYSRSIACTVRATVDRFLPPVLCIFLLWRPNIRDVVRCLSKGHEITFALFGQRHFRSLQSHYFVIGQYVEARSQILRGRILNAFYPEVQVHDIWSCGRVKGRLEWVVLFWTLRRNRLCNARLTEHFQWVPINLFLRVLVHKVLPD